MAPLASCMRTWLATDYPDFHARNGKLVAVTLAPADPGAPGASLRHLYTPERNAEELAIQKGCSCEVPEDFPQ